MLQAMIDNAVEATFSATVLTREQLWPMSEAWALGGPAFYGIGVSLELLGERLSDAALIDADMIISEAIDDGVRVRYARAELQRLFEGGNPYLSPSFHGSYITATDGRTGLLMSCEGYEFDPYGLFRNLDHFESAVRSDGFLLTGFGRDFVDAKAAVTDAMILNVWHGPTGANEA